MAGRFFNLPCGHSHSYKCAGFNVYCCSTCERYFRADEEIRYPEECPLMHEVQPIWVDPANHDKGWNNFTPQYHISYRLASELPYIPLDKVCDQCYYVAMKVKIKKANKNTGSYRLYLPKDEGKKYEGEAECFPHALTFTIARPGTSLEQVKKSLQIVLKDIELRIETE